MSLSVNGSNTNNPFASLQSLWQQASSTGGTQSQSDPLSSLLAELGQQGSGQMSATNGLASSAAGTSTAAASTSPQFSPQTLQALLALQTTGSNPQSLESQLDNATNDVDPTSALSSQQSQGQHHHHHMEASGANTTDTASPDSTASDTSSSSAGAGTVSGNNFLEQLLQMQSQLVTPAATQSIATA